MQWLPAKGLIKNLNGINSKAISLPIAYYEYNRIISCIDANPELYPRFINKTIVMASIALSISAAIQISIVTSYLSP